MKSIANAVRFVFYSFNLRSKLIISYLLLIIIPVVLLGVLTYSNVRHVVMEQTGKAYLEALKQAQKNISYKLEVATKISNQAQDNYEIQRILRNLIQRPLTPTEEIDFFSYLLNNVLTAQNNRDVLKVTYFVKNNSRFVTANPHFIDMENLKEEPVLKPLFNGSIRQGWFFGKDLKQVNLTQQDEIVFIHGIRDLTSINRTLGYIMIEMNVNTIWNTLRDIKLPDGAEIIVRHDKDLINTLNLCDKSIEMHEVFHKHNLPALEGIFTYKDDSNSGYAVMSDIHELDWNVVLLLTEEHMGMNSRKIRQFIIVIGSMVAALAVITAVFISGTITKRLRRLMNLINKAEKGTFEVDNNVRGTDEYAQLQKSFNKMSQTIKGLIEEVYQVKLSKQEAEMRLLYAQINPHFLYNTLDIIKWSALRIEASDIADISESLAKFLRLSLNGGKEDISLSEEIEEVSRYIHIVNYRYKGAIKFIAEIQEGIKDLRIIKMILQPLVENSVIHGIRPKESKKGTIVIRAYREKDYLFIESIDDGVGINRNNLSSILEKDSRGYGVKNVHQRIKIHYGEDCGLKYFSNNGIGCTVLVTLKISGQ